MVSPQRPFLVLTVTQWATETSAENFNFRRLSSTCKYFKITENDLGHLRLKGLWSLHIIVILD